MQGVARLWPNGAGIDKALAFCFDHMV
jgi:hypothetical protein